MIDRDRENPERVEKEKALEAHLQAKADIMMESVRLASALESDRGPDSIETTFIFSPEDVPSALLPQAVIDEIGREFDSLQVTFDGQRIGERMGYSILIYKIADQTDGDSASQKDTFLQLSKQMHDQPGPVDLHISHGEENPDENLIGDSQVLCKVTQEEVNRLLASLIFPSTTGDWRFFDNVDPQDPKTAMDIAEALEKVSPSIATKRHYILSDSDGGISGEFDVFEDNGMPMHLTITRRIINSVEMTPDGHLSHHERSIAAQVQTFGRTSIEFFVVDNKGKKPSWSIEPEQGELNGMLEFIENERVRLGITPPRLVGDESFDIADPLAERDDSFSEEDLD